MAFYTYILYSESLNKYYKGHTNNMSSRLKQHNLGHGTYTSTGIPWKLILSLEKRTRIEAKALESKLKNLNRERLEAFIKKYSNLDLDN